MLAGGRRTAACAVVLVLGALAPVEVHADAPRGFTMVELLDPNGEPLQQASKINERGEIIGEMATTDPPFGVAPVLWRRGRATRLSPEGVSGHAWALSEHGQVVGGAFPRDVPSTHPFSWRRGEWSLLTPDDVAGGAVDVNARGQVLGWTNPSLGEFRSIVAWHRGRVVPAPAVTTGRVDLTYGAGDQLNERGQVAVEVKGDGFSRAAIWQIGGGISELGGEGVYGLTINERGHVAGVDYRAEGPTHVLLWRDGRTIDAGSPGGNATAAAINEHDDIVGWAYLPDGGTRAFLWRDGEMIDLGSLGGTITLALDVNNRGQVVGHTTTADGESSHGFVWEDGRMTDLGEGTAAYQINDRGQILGTAGGFDARPVLWTRSTGHGHDS